MSTKASLKLEHDQATALPNSIHPSLAASKKSPFMGWLFCWKTADKRELTD
jgi:hypothetical protein